VHFFLLKGFKLGIVVKSFLHSIAIAKDADTINIYSTVDILRVLVHYATTFFVDLENWKQIRDFKNLNPQIRQIVDWLLTMGNSKVSAFVSVNSIFPLKHLCRVQIREQLNNDPAIICNQQRLLELGLPQLLSNYVVYKV
jgi:hypothetical protein